MSTIEELEKKLGSSDTEERREAAIDLGRAGAPAIPLLFRAIGDPDWRVRKTAVEALVAAGGTDVVSGLIKALDSHDNAGARNSAIEALVQIGEASVDALLGIITNPDPDVRKFAIDILGDIKDTRATPALIERLHDGDENVRVASAEALGKLRDPSAVDALLVCLTKYDQGWLDYAAAEALGKIGDERALAPLLAALGRSSLREPVLEALGSIGNASALGPLLASLADPLRIVREVSVTAINTIYRKSAVLARQKVIAVVRAAITDKAIDFLEELLITSEGDLQKSAIRLLGWSGKERSIRKLLALVREEEYAEVVEQSLAHLDRGRAGLLIEHLANDSALVRGIAAHVLGEIGASSAEEALLPLLHDENGHVRSAAAEALGRLHSARAVQPLLAMLADEYVSVQESAIRALAEIGDENALAPLLADFSAHAASLRRNIALLLGKFSGERALAALAFALKDEEPDVRKAVVQSLGRNANERTLKPLLLAVADDDPEVRMLAADALGSIRDDDSCDALLLLLKDEDIWVRAASARSLGKIGGDRAADALVSHLDFAQDIFLLAIIEVLGVLKNPKAREPLMKYAGHPDPEVRKTVLAALDSFRDESILPAVLARLSDEHWSVRKVAVELLGRRRSPSTDALLARAAESDPDEAVRLAAREALGK
jgi:HEAT repeat protein